MEEPSLKRRLAAVLYADVAGYSRLTGEDEEGTHRRLAGGLDILTAAVVRHAGRVVHFAGDAVLAEFSSAVQALACAADAQAGLAEVNRTLPAERRLEFRIGLNLGDVISDRDDIYGEGVNIAARLEALAEPGGICVSEAFRDAVGNKLPYDYEFLGARSVKNIASPVRAYRVLLEGAHGSQRVLRFGRVRLRRAASALGLTVLVTGIVGISWWAIRENLQGDQGTAGMSPPALTRQLSKLPSIAVLPFRNLGSEAGQAYFIDGITQDISTDLSRFPELMVIAASSSSAYPPDSASTGQIGHELGVRYLLEGSAERGPEKLRLNVQLVDATNGVQLWTERFERDLRSIAQTRDEIVQRVVATLAVRIEREELERVRSKDATDLAAYDYVLRGRERLARGTREDNIEARELLRRAIEIEPDAASAYLALGEVHRQAFRYGWVETPGQMLDETEALARTALRLDDTNAGGHQLLGFVYLARQRLALAENEYRRALELNPNDAESHAGYGLTLLYLGGRTQEAVAALQTARRLDPHMSPSDSVRSRAWILALALYLQGHYGDAIRVLEQHLEWFPNHAGMHALLAAAYARAGHPDKASRAARDVRRLDPFFDKARFGTGLSSEVDREHLYAGLVEAGLE